MKQRKCILVTWGIWNPDPHVAVPWLSYDKGERHIGTDITPIRKLGINIPIGVHEYFGVTVLYGTRETKH